MERSDLLKSIRKEFGEQSMFLLGDTDKLDIKVRSSGSLLLDVALGGGYPHGRIIELRGAEKSGKTTLANLAIAAAQQTEPDLECAIIDLENTYNPEWARTLGVDTEKLFVAQPDTYAEKVFNMLEYLIKTHRFSIIVLDSVAGLISKDELEQEDWTKESRVGGVSKLNAKAMRKIISSGVLTQSGTTLIFINQLQDKIGGFSMYGPATTTGGGRSLKHAYTQQLDVSVGEYFQKGTGDKRQVLGQQAKIKVAKNKIAPPLRQAKIDLYYDHGMDRMMELVSVAKEIGVLSGTSWLKLVNPATGEVVTDAEGNELKWNGLTKTHEAMIEDIETNEGAIYLQLEDFVNTAIRG